MSTSVHSIDGERLHHRMRPMGMRGHVLSVCPLRMKNVPFPWARSGPSLPVVPWTPQDVFLNGISIGSAVFVWLTVAVNKQEWQTDRQTDRPRYLFCYYTMRATRQKKTVSYYATTFCQGDSSKSKLSVYSPTSTRVFLASVALQLHTDRHRFTSVMSGLMRCLTYQDFSCKIS